MLRKILHLTLNFVLLLPLVLSLNACASSGKSSWTTNEEMKPQELPFWPCSPDELPAGQRSKGVFCSPFCPKSRPDGSCAVEKKIRVLDTFNDSDWEFIRNNDSVLAPTKMVFP